MLRCECETITKPSTELAEHCASVLTPALQLKAALAPDANSHEADASGANLEPAASDSELAFQVADNLLLRMGSSPNTSKTSRMRSLALPLPAGIRSRSYLIKNQGSLSNAGSLRKLGSVSSRASRGSSSSLRSTTLSQGQVSFSMMSGSFSKRDAGSQRSLSIQAAGSLRSRSSMLAPSSSRLRFASSTHPQQHRSVPTSTAQLPSDIGGNTSSSAAHSKTPSAKSSVQLPSDPDRPPAREAPPASSAQLSDSPQQRSRSWVNPTLANEGSGKMMWSAFAQSTGSSTGASLSRAASTLSRSHLTGPLPPIKSPFKGAVKSTAMLEATPPHLRAQLVADDPSDLVRSPPDGSDPDGILAGAQLHYGSSSSSLDQQDSLPKEASAMPGMPDGQEMQLGGSYTSEGVAPSTASALKKHMYLGANRKKSVQLPPLESDKPVPDGYQGLPHAQAVRQAQAVSLLPASADVSVRIKAYRALNKAVAEHIQAVLDMLAFLKVRP